MVSKAEVISFEELKDLFPQIGQKSLRNTVYNLSKKGYLCRLKKGLYLVTPDGSLVLRNPLSIATLIYPGYLGFSTALRLHDLMEYEPFTIFVVTHSKSRKKWLGEYTFQYIAMGRRATGAENRNGFWVSNIEKTFFDCFYKPQYAGDYEGITKALHERGALDWPRFLHYVKDFASLSLCQRIGYVLSMLSYTTDFPVPEKVLSHLHSKVHSPARLMPKGSLHGKYCKEWKLLDNVGKERILGWWYDG